MASMIAVVDVAHADTVEKLGPIKPYFIEIHPAAISTITYGIKYGLMRGVPSPLAYSMISCWNVKKPPFPDPHITPTRVLSILSSARPESFKASAADTTAY